MIAISPVRLTNIRLENDNAHFDATLKKGKTKFQCIAEGIFGTTIAEHIREGSCVSLKIGQNKNTAGENNVQSIEFGFDAMKRSTAIY
jgi:hypothetical protein